MDFRMDIEEKAGFGCFLAILTGAAAWITHVVWCINALAAGAYASQIALMVIGTIFFPVGIIHGFMIWFGYGMGA